jgi:hypothetical protein
MDGATAQKTTTMTYGGAALEALGRRCSPIPPSGAWARTWAGAASSASTRACARSSAPDRVSDAPISEAAIMAAAFGAAMVGTRPVVEMRFADFALCATDELINQIAKARFMFGGQSRAPW